MPFATDLNFNLEMSNITRSDLSLIVVDSIYTLSLSLLGLFGNICITCVFVQLELSVTSFFILNLTMLEILTCVCVILKQVVFILGDHSRSLCPILQYFLYLTTSGSPFIILAIAVDRYRKVCLVERWQISLTHAKIIMVLILLLDTILSLPNFIFYKARHGNYNRMCVIQQRDHYAFIYFILLFIMLLSIAIPIAIYYNQVCQVIKSLKAYQATNAAKVRRSIRTMSCIAIVFVLGYFPCLFVDVIDQMIVIRDQHLITRIFHCLATKSYLFSCMFYPVLTGWRDEQSWMIIKTLFKPNSSSNQTEPPQPDMNIDGETLSTQKTVTDDVDRPQEHDDHHSNL